MRDRDRAGRGTAEDRASGISPVRAFFLLGAVAAIASLTVLATRPEAAPTPAAPREPDYSLTDEEAIAEFERLRSLAFAAVRTRDVTLLDEVFTPTGPIRRRAMAEVKSLLKSGVVDRSTFVSESVAVVRNRSEEIRLIEVSRLAPCFRRSSGAVVARGPAEVRQRAMWILRLVGAEWLIEDSVIRSDFVLTKGPPSCA